ncbi:MAG TPA: glutathione transferase GstA, partial [Stellaceae bacterium]|nr:glutathione transferase GstA [Stellaceae bacterium]
KVDLATKKTATGGDYFAINPKGYAPALVLDDGQVLTEGPAILQYLGDKKPEANLMPKAGTMERVRTQEMLNFITSELHKIYGPLFRPTTPEEFKTLSRELLAKRLGFLDKSLAGKQYLLGAFGAADCYAFTVLRWSGVTKVDLSPYANIKAFMARMEARPKVQQTLKEEGLLGK